MSELTALQERLAGLIASLSPAARRQMAADIAKKLRASQQQRIKRQQAPDGSAYVARKRQPVRQKVGRIKRKMFMKLIVSRFLHIKVKSDSASMEFYGGKSAHIARVHHYGLKEKSRRAGEMIEYPARPLLGLSRDDEQLIEDVIISHLGK